MSRRAWSPVAAAGLVLWLTAVPAARALPIACDRSPYDVDLALVYANGMFTSHALAVANLLRLRPLVDQQLRQEPYAIAYGLAYNTNEKLLAQARKVVRERVSLTGAELIRVLSGAKPVPAAVRDELAKLAAEYVQAGFLDDEDLEQHVQMYRDHLRKGRKVVVIAHSEGNFYANAAFERLFRTALPTPGERSFGIVGVALPAPRIVGWQPPSQVPGCSELGCYTTFYEDLVVGAVAQLVAGTAPPNVTGGMLAAGFRDFGWHGLTESYLAARAAREQILAQVAAYVNAFEPLAPVINQSQVSASLEWDTGGDLDLHVWEEFKSYRHVYVEYPDDGAGKLEADDQDGYGPENYYVECSELDKGDLRFAVGYYAGSGPVTARLRIKVGTSVRTFSRVLEAALGEQSLTDPEDFAVVEVKNRPRPADGQDQVGSDDQLIDDYEVELRGIAEAD